MKRKLKFENYKKCLEATQLDNNIKYLDKNKIKLTQIVLKQNNKSILKTQ